MTNILKEGQVVLIKLNNSTHVQEASIMSHQPGLGYIVTVNGMNPCLIAEEQIISTDHPANIFADTIRRLGATL